jgi:CBS domain-containing protein/mannitol/fructose-specific phosphotransferase system IIA component (Ntr-type)
MPAKSLIELLPREHILVPLRAVTVEEAANRLVHQLVVAGSIRDENRAAQLLREPRRRTIVSIGPRAALPHYRTDLVNELVVGLGVAPKPLQSDNPLLDNQPSIVVLILAPPDSSTLYLQTVAALARLLRNEHAAQRLADARSPDDVLALPELQELRIQPSLTVRDIMLHNVDSIAPATPLRDAVDLMVRRDIRALPVVGEKGEVLGIVSETDVMRGLLARIPRVAEGERGPAPESSELIRVRDVMTRSVLCVSEDLGLAEAANLMNNKNVEQLPVTNEGKLSGFLTRGDIIRKLFAR